MMRSGIYFADLTHMNPILEEVRSFAAEAHKNQRRKYSPEPYIVHPVRVMEICSEYHKSNAVLAASLLHDVLEDTPIKKIQLQDFLLKIMPQEEAMRTIKLVVELTDIYTKDNYPEWNRRKRKSMELQRIQKTSSEAQTIKYADIIDNSPEIADEDPEFAYRFLSECRQLLKKTDKGHPVLYRRAVHIVDECLQRLH